MKRCTVRKRPLKPYDLNSKYSKHQKHHKYQEQSQRSQIYKALRSYQKFFPLKRWPVKRLPLEPSDLNWHNRNFPAPKIHLRPSRIKSMHTASAHCQIKGKSATMCAGAPTPFSLKPSVTLSPSLGCRNFHISKKFNPRSIVRQKPFVKFCQIGDSSSNLKGERAKKESWVITRKL